MKNKKEDLRRFGFGLGLGLNILGFIMYLRARPHFIYFSTAGSCTLILGIFCPAALMPLKKTLDKLIFCIAWLTKTITSLAAFYLIFAPIGILLRALGRDPLHQKIDKNVSSYWTQHKKAPFSKALYERMG